MTDEIRFAALCGMLGYGYPLSSLDAALACSPAFIGVDAGSTDPGPYYLGTGTAFVKAAQVRRDLEPALCAAVRQAIPLIIGSAGGSGAAPHLAWFLDILRDIAADRRLHFRLAVIEADIPAPTVTAALRRGGLVPCGGAPTLRECEIAACSHIVAQMGTAPIIAALDAGANVIVAGRCCDTAIFAAPLIRRGADPALALHVAKIAECGTLCARPGGANDTLIGAVGADRFWVEPANPAKRCLPETVAAHSLYEQPDPNCFFEPEGKVDMSDCVFAPQGDRAVCVRGTRLLPADQPSIKLEGAARRGFRAISVAGVRDPGVIASFAEIEAGVTRSVAAGLQGTIAPAEYSLRFLRYGLDGVTQRCAVPNGRPPEEMGVVIEVIAPTQERADTVLALARSTALHQHFEGRKTTAGNLAFPFSPSDFQGGPVYEFVVYHLMRVADERAMFPIRLEQL